MAPIPAPPGPGAGLAAVFPGQGSQRAGMGRDLLARWPEIVEPYFRAADEIVGFDLRAVCLDAPAEVLSRTEITQPALFTISVAVLEVLRRHGIQPAATAGHSLGEFAALVCAGALDWEDGLRLVHTRGRLMAVVGESTPGSMAAVIGLPAETVEMLCHTSRGAGAGTVEVANYNETNQTVVSGDRDAVARTAEAAEHLGARVVLLQVSAPFHCSLMAAMETEFAVALGACPIRDPRLPVVVNASGALAANASEVRDALRLQLAGPVQWVKTLRCLNDIGCAAFVEVGPGRVLTGLTKGVLPDAVAFSTGDAKRIDAFLSRHAEAVRPG